MAERRTDVKLVYVEMICDDCGDGHMIYTGNDSHKKKWQYEHCCDNCLSTGYYDEKYPRYEESNEENG